jgi:hypothetical protein
VTQRGKQPGVGWRWAAYGACVVAAAYAVVSLYWALGGTAGLDRVGGVPERMARSGGTVALLVIAVTILVKVLGALLALALARPRERRRPRRWWKRARSSRRDRSTGRRCAGIWSCGIPGFWSGDCCSHSRHAGTPSPGQGPSRHHDLP